MAEENTTDLTPTPTDQPSSDPSPAPASENGSTTEPTPNPTPEGDDAGEAAPETILTPKDGEPEGDEPKPQTDKEKAAAAEHAKLFGAPEGDYEITGLPEGMEIDKAALDAITPAAKELGLSNEGLAKIAGVYAEKVLPGVQDRIVEGIEREVAAKHAEWAGEAQKMIAEDPAFEGKKLDEIQKVAAKTLDRFFGEDTREFLATTGLGNYPPLVKGMYMIGTMISEDNSFERGAPTNTPRSRTEKFYGPQPQSQT